MTKKKKANEKELGEERSQIEIGKVTFSFSITRDEADKVINKPNHQVARKLKRFMKSILETAAKKMLESKPDEDVSNCKLDIE